MSLRINTNVAALNAYNNLSTNQTKLEERVQPAVLGSADQQGGRRRRRPVDRQGLTSQINGLTQAVVQRPGRHQRRPDRRRRSRHRAGHPAAHAHPGRAGRERRYAGLELARRDPVRGHEPEHAAEHHRARRPSSVRRTCSTATSTRRFQVGANGGETISLDLSKIAGAASSGVDDTKLGSQDAAA